MRTRLTAWLAFLLLRRTNFFYPFRVVCERKIGKNDEVRHVSCFDCTSPVRCAVADLGDRFESVQCSVVVYLNFVVLM